MHDTLTIGIPLMAILAGVLLNRQDVYKLGERLDARISRLEDKMDAGFAKADARMDAGFARADARMDAGFERLHNDLRQFDRTLGQHDARLDSLEDRTKP
jgi:hypothetical protein